MNYTRSSDEYNAGAMRIDPDPDNQSTLDGAVIARLRRDLEEDSDLVITSYLESIDEYLCEIANRQAQTAPDDLHRWAHTIKSSAASIGAMRLAHLAAQMENAFRAQQAFDVESQLRHMQEEYRQVCAGLGG